MEEIKKWLEKAEKDLDDAKFNFGGERFEVAAFLCHQAAEKSLKALFISKFESLWRIHDLKMLGEKVEAPEEILQLCDGLNPAYLETRYPLDIEYTKEEAEEFLVAAERVME